MSNTFSREKIEIEVTVLDIQNRYPVKWSAIKDFKFEDNDEIISGYSEPYYTENNSSDGFFYLEIRRKRLETDDEFNKRQEKNVKIKEELKKRRYDSFLKLKAEFEPES